MLRREHPELEFGNLRHPVGRAEPGPDDLPELAGRVCGDSDPVLVGRVRRHVRQIDRPAAHVELPAVIDAAQPALLVAPVVEVRAAMRSEEHTSELQSLMRISYAVFCLKKHITNKS